LRYGENRAADIEQRSIHLPGFVLEDSKVYDFPGEHFGICGRVTFLDAE
jgi:hypothetical protein